MKKLIFSLLILVSAFISASAQHKCDSVETGYGIYLYIDDENSLWGFGTNLHGILIGGKPFQRYSLSESRHIMDNVRQVSAGSTHVAAVCCDSTLWVWGKNNIGQLGNGTTSDCLRPVKIMDNVKQVSTDFAHTLALCCDGSLWAWGWNKYGQLGDGTTKNQDRPVKIMDNVRDYRQIRVTPWQFSTTALFGGGVVTKQDSLVIPPIQTDINR